MYICLLPQNQLLCRQAAVVAMQLVQLLCQQATIDAMQLRHISIYIPPSLNRIERGLVGEPGPRTSKIANFLQQSITVYKAMYIC